MIPPPPRRPRVAGIRRSYAWLAALVVAGSTQLGCGAEAPPRRAAQLHGSGQVKTVDASAPAQAGELDAHLASVVVPRDGVSRTRERPPITPAATSPSTAAHPLDPDVRRVALALAGAAPDETLPDERARDAQRRHRESLAAAWANYDREIGLPMTAWAKAEVAPPASGTTRIVFYPFGGADFVTAHRLAPDATRYVMVAMQRAGPVPDLDALKVGERSAVLRALRHRVEAFSRSGFFVTTQMNETYHRALPVKGITGQLMLFAELEGYDVLDVSPIRVDRETAELVVRTEAVDRPSTWSSVRLDLRRRSDGAHVTLDYLRLDLSNRGLRPQAVEVHPGGDGAVEVMHPHERWLRSVAGDMVVLKAASHLPQQAAFSRIRDAIVDEASVLIQDETAIDFDTLSAHFDVRLFGDYREANELFDGRRQASLAEAYARAGEVSALPFAYGYRKRAGASLQLGHAKEGASAISDGKIASAGPSD